jgi:hypothetical protein
MPDTPPLKSTDDQAKPKGHALEAAALLALLTFDQRTFEGAMALWDDAVSESWQPLLRWKWNPSIQQFIRPSGRPVAAEQTRGLRDLIETYVGHEVAARAHAAAVGDISIDIWQRWMAKTLKSLWLVMAAIAMGGWSKLSSDVTKKLIGTTPDDKSGLQYQMVRLAGFGQQIESGQRLANTLPAIENRASLYVAASYAEFQTLRRRSHRDAVDENGVAIFLFERNVLDDDAAHCQECPELTELGWVAIGTLPPPGTRECGILCRCDLEFSKEQP